MAKGQWKLNGWHREWLERNGFVELADNHWDKECGDFVIQVQLDPESRLFAAEVVVDATWSFTAYQWRRTPKEAVQAAIEGHRRLEEIVHRQNEFISKMEMVQ